MKLYGPSDYQDISVTHADGTKCHHNLKVKRHQMPSYGDQVRSLPVVDCAKCEKHLLKEGFASHPEKVRRTADELEFEERAEREGNIYSRVMSAQLGETLAKLVTDKNSR